MAASECSESVFRNFRDIAASVTASSTAASVTTSSTRKKESGPTPHTVELIGAGYSAEWSNMLAGTSAEGLMMVELKFINVELLMISLVVTVSNVLGRVLPTSDMVLDTWVVLLLGCKADCKVGSRQVLVREGRRVARFCSVEAMLG